MFDLLVALNVNTELVYGSSSGELSCICTTFKYLSLVISRATLHKWKALLWHLVQPEKMI